MTRISLRDFRCYATADVELGAGITVIHGRNGAGKTNLLDAVYLGATGASSRTKSDRELVRFGEQVARVELYGTAADGPHVLAVGISPGDRRWLTADGQVVERLSDVAPRPLAAVFLPDRLELIKGTPALRRNHLDQVVAALWPARREHRRAYGQVLAQRNALLHRGRHGASISNALAPWDAELARNGIAVMSQRAEAVGLLEQPFARLAADLGLDGVASVGYRPRSPAGSAGDLLAELADRRDSDIERGFTQHGPHRDELALRRDGRELRTYGSQGEQRLALLALLLAEREVLGEVRGEPPLMLLDDVMSELDAGRRARLVEHLRGGGQALLTTTDLAHVPGSESADVTRIAVTAGTVLQEALAA